MAKQGITLYYRDGGSDKVYEASIDEVSGGFTVNFAYGRRGSALKAGTKTNAPVAFEQAVQIYDKLVLSKTSKGYSPGEGGTPFSLTDKAGAVSGIGCQLLNPIDEEELEDLVANNDYFAQEKYDGERRLIQKTEDAILGINRKGLYVPLPQSLVTAASLIPTTFVIDGEAIGDRLEAFDLIELDGVDFRPLGAADRLDGLCSLLTGRTDGTIGIPATAHCAIDKRLLLEASKANNAEGVVFKNRSAPYVPGRPASGGNQRKFKFYATASAIVSAVNAQRSVALDLIDAAGRVPVGNVTIPANHDVPSAGSIVEVRYLYAYRGGSLYQPTYLGRRDDIDAGECSIDQLKYKAA